MSNYSNETSVELNDLMPPFQLVTIQRINRILCNIFGIPLNILVVIVILRSKQLWSARNIFWLAVTFFNLLALTQSLTELSIFYLRRRADGSHQTLCAVYSTLLGYPYALLLTGLTLASWDRYLALACRQFYQHHVTPTNISLILIGVFIAVTGGQTSPYWLGILPIKCGLRNGWISATLCFQGLLSFACLTVQIRLFIFVRTCVRYSPSSPKIRKMNLISQNLSTNSSATPSRQQTLQNQRINRLELRAARILGMGILPFCLITLSLCVSSVALLFVTPFKNQELGWLQLMMMTLREFLLLHLVYIPTIFVVQSQEFRSAFKRFFRNKRPKPVEQYVLSRW